jgi:hypothetical protein
MLPMIKKGCCILNSHVTVALTIAVAIVLAVAVVAIAIAVATVVAVINPGRISTLTSISSGMPIGAVSLLIFSCTK